MHTVKKNILVKNMSEDIKKNLSEWGWNEDEDLSASFIETIKKSTLSLNNLEVNRIFITGDTHGNFERIINFCEKQRTTKNDVLIILGDVGINYGVSIMDKKENQIIYTDSTNKNLKKRLSDLPVTLFCIQGNHEARAENVRGYDYSVEFGGIVYVQPKFPNLIFAKDGETYYFNKKKIIVLGGAYSVDKYRRLMLNKAGRTDVKWFADEQMTKETKDEILNKVKADNEYDIVLSHTCPYSYRPTEAFIAGIGDEIDTSTEEYLDKIQNIIDYNTWYCGHWHIEKKIDKMRFLFEDIIELN